jgi:hypothetical protein
MDILQYGAKLGFLGEAISNIKILIGRLQTIIPSYRELANRDSTWIREIATDTDDHRKSLHVSNSGSQEL